MESDGTAIKLGTPAGCEMHPLVVSFREQPHGRTLLEINMDGSVELAEGMTPDDASQAFWEAMKFSNPLIAQVNRQQDEIAGLQTLVGTLYDALDAMHEAMCTLDESIFIEHGMMLQTREQDALSRIHTLFYRTGIDRENVVQRYGVERLQHLLQLYYAVAILMSFEEMEGWLAMSDAGEALESWRRVARMVATYRRFLEDHAKVESARSP